MISAVKSVAVLPDQITSIIRSLGKVKVGDKLYVPKTGIHNETTDRMFIPQSEQICLSNLRRTVESLSNPETPAAIRRRFYRNSPIPGAIWVGAPEDPLLNNPDEIMPDNYNVQRFNDDVLNIRAKLNFLNKKAPKYFTGPVTFEPEGTKALLTCNRQNE